MTDARIPMGEGRLREALEAILEVRVQGWENIWAGSNRCQEIARKALAFADTPPPAAAGDRVINQRELIALLRREGAYSGVWFADKLIEAANALEAALRTPEPNSGGEATNA